MLVETKLNTIEILISNFWTFNWLIYCHDEVVLVNNMLRKYDYVKEEIKILGPKQFINDFNPFIKQSYCLKCGKNAESETLKVRKTSKGKIML